jgi:hypothetical protein
MRRSFFAFVTVAFTLTMVGCSTQSGQPQKPLPTATVRTATMNITSGIEVLARLALPDGFVPSVQYPPMWLQTGAEVAVAGTRNGRSTIMGYSGPGYRTERVIAEDGGIGAPGGRLVDIAPSPNGMVLALVVVKPKENQLEVVTRDVISGGAANPISSFDGEFDSASVAWSDDFTILLALRAHPNEPQSPPDTDASSDSTPATAPTAAEGLYIITDSGVIATGYLKLNCKMSRLSWSPAGNAAAGAGDPSAPPVVIDRGKESCQRINAGASIRVVDWAHDSQSFLFQNTTQPLGTGIYRYDLRTNTARMVAIASGAAANVTDDQLLALGNRGLTFRDAQAPSDRSVRAQVALSTPSGNDIELESLGFNTTPAMLAASTMTYTRATDAAAIQAFSPSTEGPVREIVTYSVAPKRAFVIAFGPARGLATMSWSPRGHYLALVDGDEAGAALTIISPPR